MFVKFSLKTNMLYIYFHSLLILVTLKKIVVDLRVCTENYLIKHGKKLSILLNLLVNVGDT